VLQSPVTEEELQNIISKTKGKSSAVYDEIPEYLVKECIKYIKKPLSFIFNTSLKSGVFPELMKIAKVKTNT
jgi:hypothetical protein